jgi:hypothetical protein
MEAWRLAVRPELDEGDFSSHIPLDLPLGPAERAPPSPPGGEGMKEAILWAMKAWISSKSPAG